MSKAKEELEPIQETQPECDSCGAVVVPVGDYEDPGDPSVGYGPITETLCEECAERVGAS